MNQKKESSNKVSSFDKKLYSTIRDRIALLEYRPGESISEEELVEEFDCSRTPIRKALIRLENEDLVERVPKSGTYVTRVSFQDLKELFKTRKHLLKLVSELVVKNIEPQELDMLESLVTKMNEKKDPKELIKLDLEFHRRLHQATHNRLIERIMGNIIVKATQIWLFSIDRKLALQFSEDHSKFVEEVKKENLEEARKILLNHAQQTIEYVKQDLADI